MLRYVLLLLIIGLFATVVPTALADSAVGKCADLMRFNGTNDGVREIVKETADSYYTRKPGMSGPGVRSPKVDRGHVYIQNIRDCNTNTPMQSATPVAKAAVQEVTPSIMGPQMIQPVNQQTRRDITLSNAVGNTTDNTVTGGGSREATPSQPVNWIGIGILGIVFILFILYVYRKRERRRAKAAASTLNTTP